MGLRLIVIYRKVVEWFGFAYQGQKDKEVIGFCFQNREKKERGEAASVRVAN